MDKLGKIGLALLMIIGIAICYAFPIMLFWDWSMPAIFGLPEITLFQSFSLGILSGLLLKS